MPEASQAVRTDKKPGSLSHAMTPRSISQFAIQGTRLFLLPFPVSYYLSMLSLEVTDHILRPDRSNITSGDAGENVGGLILVILVAILQITVGVPSLLVLDSVRGGARPYFATAMTASLILSLLSAVMLRAPQLGETFEWMFFWAFCFLGPPIIISYLLAYYLRRHCNQTD
jgi:hypothetical protein